jgi:hypothetical protein
MKEGSAEFSLLPGVVPTPAVGTSKAELSTTIEIKEYRNKGVLNNVTCKNR